MIKQFPRLFERMKLRRHSRTHIQENKKQSLQMSSAAIISIPPGAKIFVDDIDRGVTSSAIISDIDSSTTHTLKLVLDGHEDYIDNFFTVTDGYVETYYIFPIPISHSTQIGNLSITSSFVNTEFMAMTTSTGIETFIDGIAPTTFNDIPSGIYGYETYSAGPPESSSMGSFEILSGRTTYLDLSLGPIDPGMAGTLIESIPPGADIYVDGSSINAKTAFFRGFTPENHTYELRMPEYQTKTGSFTPVLNMPTIISDVLQPISDSGSVIMVAGAVVLGLTVISGTK